jgi:head-tail adaptor
MRAGALTHRVRIEQPPDWTEVAKWWAERQDVASLDNPETLIPEVTTRWHGRWISGVTHHMRINEDGTMYDIRSVLDTDGRAREMEILAVRREMP